MTSKALLNNMQTYKKRDASVDLQTQGRFLNKTINSDKLSLPQLKKFAHNNLQA